MTSLTDPRALPSPARLAMGLKPLEDRPVLWPDTNRADELAFKQNLWEREGREVFDALTECDAEQQECYALLAEELGARHGLSPSRNPHPALLDIGLQVQEDLLLLTAHAHTYRLIAGALFFPALWRLQDKIGKGLAGIHAPVPHYDSQLDVAMNRLFARLQTSQPLERFNWTIHDTPDLYRPGVHGEDGADWPVDPMLGEKLWLRGERQVLVRLPQTGAILFTIKTWREKLGTAVARDPGWAEFLFRVLDEMPAQMKAYKSLTAKETALRHWLAEKTGI